MLEWTYAGINFSAKNTEPWADDGGMECAAHSTIRQRLTETALCFIVAVCEIYYAMYYAKQDRDCRSTSFPREYARERQGRPSVLRRLVLVFYALMWGVEIGFKLASRQLIYILNPCHIVTLIQVKATDSAQKAWLVRRLREIPIRRMHAEVTQGTPTDVQRTPALTSMERRNRMSNILFRRWEKSNRAERRLDSRTDLSISTLTGS